MNMRQHRNLVSIRVSCDMKRGGDPTKGIPVLNLFRCSLYAFTLAIVFNAACRNRFKTNIIRCLLIFTTLKNIQKCDDQICQYLLVFLAVLSLFSDAEPLRGRMPVNDILCVLGRHARSRLKLGNDKPLSVCILKIHPNV